MKNNIDTMKGKHKYRDIIYILIFFNIASADKNWCKQIDADDV